jgi:aryl sulfotransferase
MIATLETQQHRRSLKSHLPLDGLPIFDEIKYIHITRDGRDVCLSYHNHVANFSSAALEQLDREGLADETIGRPYPRAPNEAAEFFRTWLREGVVPGHSDGSPTVSFFVLERAYWAERKRPNFLLLHYNDLKADLRVEMQRVADFLQIEISEALWPQLVQAASFEAMRRDALQIAPHLMGLFAKGAETFFFKGTMGRWRGVLSQEDLELYEVKVRALLSPACAEWTEHGRGGGADPNLLAD